MTLEVITDRRVTGINAGRVRRLFDFLISRSVAPKWRGGGEISLVLTDDSGIRAVNRIHLGHDDVTDVISYFFPALPGASAPVRGEIFANVELARKIGPRHGGANRELALYIAHGCDHLAGEDDSNPALRRRMRRRELRWLGEASDLGLLTGLIRA